MLNSTFSGAKIEKILKSQFSILNYFVPLHKILIYEEICNDYSPCGNPLFLS